MVNFSVRSLGLRAAVSAMCLLLSADMLSNSVAAEQSGKEDIATTRQQNYAAYSSQLRNLADWCDSKKLPKQAEFTRAWLPQRDASMIYIFALPENSAPPATLVSSSGDTSSTDGATGTAQQWWTQFMDLRRAQADKLFDLAKAALKAHQPALAYELARETVRENPDHEASRKILDLRKRNDRWVSRETLRRLAAGQVWSEIVGWIPVDQAPRYEHGQRFYRGQWISPAEDARLHSNIYNAWQIESDHYLVVTNQSLEEGVALAKKLEVLYDVWRQVFVRFYAKPTEIDRWFDNDAAPASISGLESGSQKLHQVIFFHNKQQYVDALQAAQPQIDKSLGFYSIANKSAYFFVDDQQYDGTIYHEATHQLFQETRPAVSDPGRKNNFWIYEGVACYMESLAEHRLLEGEPYGMYYTVGGQNGGRVPAARKRLLDDNFYFPFRELVAIGRQDFQHDPRIAPLYSQAAGQTFFLMHAAAGRYRPALMDYLIALYNGHINPETLEKLAGVKYEELDQQYREFLK